MTRLIIFIFPVFLFFSACSKNQNKISEIKENRQDLEMISSYQDAYEALEQGDLFLQQINFGSGIVIPSV